jgi:hypothetical protein
MGCRRRRNGSFASTTTALMRHLKAEIRRKVMDILRRQGLHDEVHHRWSGVLHSGVSRGLLPSQLPLLIVITKNFQTLPGWNGRDVGILTAYHLTQPLLLVCCFFREP